MDILRKKSLAREAFKKGFLMGLASPVLLDRSHAMPADPQLVQVSAPSTSLPQTLAGDWSRVGVDIATVIKRHGQAA